MRRRLGPASGRPGTGAAGRTFRRILPRRRRRPARAPMWPTSSPRCMRNWPGTCPVLGLRDFPRREPALARCRTAGHPGFSGRGVVHPAYDLVSGLQDARRDVDRPSRRRRSPASSRRPGPMPTASARLTRCWGAQRGLRIMGIFTCLAQRDGKRRYLAFMPRVWDAIQRDLAHPALAPLARALTGIPAHARGDRKDRASVEPAFDGLCRGQRAPAWRR